MSAREELEDHLIGIQGMPEDRVFRMLDAYAHELAEKVRQALDHEESMLTQAHVPLHEVLARRIDPEVSDE